MNKNNYPVNFIRKIIDRDLKNGKHTTVHTRFPPEPNGYLHIGHAKSICLNFGIAQDYQGKCNLRIDDTNPAEEDVKYIESIKNDIKWLGFQWFGEICYSSNYFDYLYAYAIELIKKGLAYVDELSQKEIREYRGTLTTPGKNSPFRDRNIKENMVLFEKMRSGEFKEGKACLRAKINMESPYIAMRDPVLYRIRFDKHHQTGNRWCIYPMYDFAHCISDAKEGITHSLCTLEFQTNRCLYDWFLENLSVPTRPCQYEFSRLNLEYTVTSKRKLCLLVKKKKVDGWDDPRMPTIAGLRRRGYTSSSIRKFCECIGISRQDNIVKIDLLESCIRKDLNENAPRVMAVIDPIKLIIENYPHEMNEVIIMQNHPKKPEMGSREVLFSREVWIDRADFREKADRQYKRLTLGVKVRLRNAYVIKAERIEKDEYGNISVIYCTYDTSTLRKDLMDGQKVKNVIHWVNATYAFSIEIRMYNHLFKVKNPSLEKDFFSLLNPDSLIIKYGFAEPSLKKAKVGEAYQFEREGYFCLDSRYTSNDKLVFNRIVSLRNNFQKRTIKYD